jgi:protein arginine N-methyltransferase 1
MQEPVVDVCDAEQICTSASCVLSIDLATVTLEDLAFSAKFSLSAARNDYVHALVAYFDCTFSACHKPVMLSTSPRAPYTHWKQTVLYLDEVLVVNAGESLEGEIRVRRNEKNPRDVDIHLQLALDGEHGSYEVTQEYRLR